MYLGKPKKPEMLLYCNPSRKRALLSSQGGMSLFNQGAQRNAHPELSFLSGLWHEHCVLTSKHSLSFLSQHSHVWGGGRPGFHLWTLFTSSPGGALGSKMTSSWSAYAMGQIRSASPWKIATPYLKRSTSSLGILPMLVIHQCTSPVLENCKSGYHSVSHTPSSTLTDTSIAPTFTPLTEGETKVSGGCPPPASSPRKQVTSWRQSSQWSKPETLCLWWPNQSLFWQVPFLRASLYFESVGIQQLWIPPQTGGTDLHHWSLPIPVLGSSVTFLQPLQQCSPCDNGLEQAHFLWKQL